MLKPVPAPAASVRPHHQPDIVDEVVLRRQPFTLGFDVGDGVLDARRYCRHPKRFARDAGGLQHPLRLGRQGFDAPDQQLPQPLGETCGLGSLSQRPLALSAGHQPLLHQMLHDINHEQRIALGMPIHQFGECCCHRPAQVACHVACDF